MKNFYLNNPNLTNTLPAPDISQDKYKVLIDQSLTAFLLTTPDGTILETNNAAVEMFGYSSDEFKTLTRQDIIDHNDPGFLTVLQQKEKSGFARTEATGIKKNGDRFPIAVFSAFFTNVFGEVRTSTLINNISELKKTSKDLKQVLDCITDGFFTVDSNW